MDKLDYKKAYKEYYLPADQPVIVDIPEMKFIQIDGKGDPSDENGEYGSAVELLYAIAYTIKMMPRNGTIPEGYFDYVVPPLEGLWWLSDYEEDFDYANKSKLVWTSMIRQPEFVTEEVFLQACAVVEKKKKLDCSKVRLVQFSEGLCVQCMHFGPYKDEPATVEKMKEYVKGKGYTIDLTDDRMHHEIYLSDPRKTESAKMKTVLRYPIR